MSSPSYDELLRHYSDAEKSFFHYFLEIVERRVVDDEYSLMSPLAVNDVYYKRLEESEIQTCMILLASIEGIIRIDYASRLNWGSFDLI